MKLKIAFSVLMLMLLSSCFGIKELEGRFYPEEGSFSMVEYVEFMKDGRCEIKNNLLKTVKSGNYVIKDDVAIISKTGQTIVFSIISKNEIITENLGWKGTYLKK
ncbi:MAG: hypothetical protein JW982_15395 [Spirochaetes bacterium]|nr:hypothetical protein [Spirochaetota bacterium]